MQNRKNVWPPRYIVRTKIWQSVRSNRYCRVELGNSQLIKSLGIPLSVYKRRRSDKQFLVDAVARRIPGWKGSLLNLAGRTTLVRSTLSAIPVHLSIVIGLLVCRAKELGGLGVLDLRRAVVAFAKLLPYTFSHFFWQMEPNNWAKSEQKRRAKI